MRKNTMTLTLTLTVSIIQRKTMISGLFSKKTFEDHISQAYSPAVRGCGCLQLCKVQFILTVLIVPVLLTRGLNQAEATGALEFRCK